MRLRRSFLARITLAALTSSILSQAAVAHAMDTHEMAPGAQILMDSNNKAYAKYKALEAKFLANPQGVLDMLIHVGNNPSLFSDHSLTPEEAGKPKYNLAIQYGKNLPAGDVAFLSMSNKVPNQATVMVTVHELAKTNPFILLESMANLNEIFDLSTIKGNKTTVLPGTSIEHHGFEALHSYYESLSSIMGLNFKSGPSSSSGISSTMVFLEMKANAEGGSIFSQRALSERDVLLNQSIKNSMSSFTPIKNLTDDKKLEALAEYGRLKGLEVNTKLSYADALMSVQDQIDLRQKNKVDKLNAQAKLELRRQNSEFDSAASEREQVVQTKSLSEMVKANDRAGVADAMEKIFPWAIMEPVEKVFWKDYIEAIRHPNYDGAHILFRGMDENEKLQEVRDAKGKIVSGGLFSKRLTAGSGSHLYKLKGMRKTFETFGTKGNRLTGNGKPISPLVQPHTLSRMMSNHAADPNGSPFISLTYDARVASGFGAGQVKMDANTMPDSNDPRLLPLINSNASGGVATLRIDKRRTLVNTISGFNGELEVLASMLIFPDEVLYMEKGMRLVFMNKHGHYLGQMDRLSTEEYYKNARSIVYQKTGINLPENYQDYAREGEKSFRSGLANMQDLFSRTNPNTPMSCSKVFR